MLSCVPSHLTRLPGHALAAVFLGGALLTAGCQLSSDQGAGAGPAPLVATLHTPTAVPATPALFAASRPSPPPPVEYAPLPPRPPDPGQVARQALAPTPVTRGAGGAGLIVCDPVCTAPPLEPFGDGCGRWLDLVAAGQPELGRTPLWEARARAQQELGLRTLRLSPDQATGLAATTGATHAACGTLTGTPALCTLTYRLYSLRQGAPVGPAVTRSGTQAQVLAGLPAVARALDARLGVAAPRVPASVGLSPAALTQTMTISGEGAVSDADLLTLSRLSARAPLAGMYYLDTRATDDQSLLTGAVKALLGQLPANTLALAHIGYVQPGALRPYAAATGALIAHYPQSALLAHTQVWQQRVWGTRAGESAAVGRATADAPGDPETWLSRSRTLQNVAEDLRQGRFAGDMSPADWSVLGRIYPQAEAADLRATALDPRDGHAWYRLAADATFAGDGARAAGAFGRALALDPNKQEVYVWGLQMYQPKWDGDAAALGRVAALAAQPWDNSQAATDVAENLRSAGLAAQATQVLADFVTRQRALVAKNPSDAVAHWGLAAALGAQATPPSLREACLEYRVAAHLMPGAAGVHKGLAGVLDQQRRATEAVAEYRRAAALDPFDADTHFSLGYDLKHLRQFPQALAELRLAMRLDPRNADAHSGLGDLLSMRHQYRPALAEYREAIRMQFYSLEAWINLPNALDECKQYDASLAAGREADHVLTELQGANAETEAPIHDTMADDYLHKRDWVRSIAQSQAALGYAPNDACAHENLGEAYSGEGKTAKARAEWQKAAALGDSFITPIAQKRLAARP